MVLPDVYPPDVRVDKEARTLREAGHEITLVCRAGGDQPAEERIDGVRVLRVGASLTERLMRYPSAAANLLTTVHPLWERKLDAVLRGGDVDLLHAHDLPAVKTSVRAGNRHGVPVVADLHENFPEAVRQWRKPHRGPGLIRKPAQLAKRAFMPIARYKRLERAVVPEADHVVTVTTEAADHYVDDCGVPRDRLTVVGNTVDRDRFDPGTVEPVDLGDGFVATYVGGFGPHRGLLTAVEAMGHLDHVDPEPTLVLVGSGPDAYERRLREAAADAGVSDRVRMTGWVDFVDVPGYIAGSDACLVPHVSTPHTNTTVPHKLFQYMALRKPVVVSDVDPLTRIVSRTRSGPVVPAGDARAMARALEHLANHPGEAMAFRANGRRAVDRRYNWSTDGQRLLAVYDELG